VKRKPPQWQRFDRWVVLGALVGLGIAFGLFCVVHFLLYGNFAFIKHMQALASATEVKPVDIFSMTATALGGFTIGGVAVMQLRKHKWAEYQAKLDEGTKTGERLRAAIEHLGADGGKDDKKNVHIRLGAIYELKRLVEDSPRDRRNTILIFTEFINACKKTGNKVPSDVQAAAKVLSQWVREDIETFSKAHAKQRAVISLDERIGLSRNLRGNKKLNEKFLRWIHKLHLAMRPDSYIFEACEAISSLERENMFQWEQLNAKRMNLRGLNAYGIDLSNAHLEKTSLSAATLLGAKMLEAHLEGAILSLANIAGASLVGTHLQEAFFEETNIWWTIFHHAHLEGADFCDAMLNEGTKIGQGYSTHIDDKTRFDPGVRMKYFGVEEPEHDD